MVAMSVTALVLAALEGAGIAMGKGGASAAGGGASKFAWNKVFGGEAKAAEHVMAMALVRAIEESTSGSDLREEAWWTRAGQRLIKPFANKNVASGGNAASLCMIRPCRCRTVAAHPVGLRNGTAH